MTKFDDMERLLFLAFILMFASQGLFLVQALDLGLHIVAGGFTLFLP
ncbi:MAG: hypothetical protein ABGX04_16725 [Myxococcales bacterium]